MFKTVLYLGGIWLFVIVVILFTTVISPAMNDIADQSVAAMETGNMTGIIGVEDAVRSYSVWKWFIPIFVGVVLSGFVLYKNRDEVFNRRY